MRNVLLNTHGASCFMRFDGASCIKARAAGQKAAPLAAGGATNEEMDEAGGAGGETESVGMFSSGRTTLTHQPGAPDA